jgi:hypothetical protein
MKENDWRNRLETFLKEQHGTAGWEMKLENFVSSLLSEQQEGIMRGVEGMKIEPDVGEYGRYNDGLRDVLTLLNTTKED